MLDFVNSPVFKDAPIAYSVLDGEGRQLAASQRFWDLFGFEPGTELSAADLTHDDDQEKTSDYISRLSTAVDNDNDYVAVEKRYVRADGTAFWGRLTARRVPSCW